MSQFKEIKIRVCAIIHCAGQVALIHRRKNDQDSYTIPGGNLDEGEDIVEGLKRELHEELDINFAHVLDEPVFLAVQDQMVSRPGSTPPPRKLHMIFGLAIQPDLKKGMARSEKDDLGEGKVVWVDIDKASELHLYPAAGKVISQLTVNAEKKTSSPMLLPAMTDRSFSWR